MLAAHLTARIEALDADVVEESGPVHRGGQVGLGDHQQFGATRMLFEIYGQPGHPIALRAPSRSQHPERGAFDQFQRKPTAVLDEVVAAVADEGEMVADQPFEELARVGGGGGIDPGYIDPADLVDHRARGVEHARPVFHGRAHIGQHAHQIAPQCLALGRIADPVDLDAHPRLARRTVRGAPLGTSTICAQTPPRVALHRHDRMHDQMQHRAAPVDLHRHRIDQERHVVVLDLDDRVRRVPAVIGNGGVEHAHRGFTRRALLHRPPLTDERAEQVGRVALGEIVGIDVGVEVARQLGDGRTLGGLDASLDEFEYARDRGGQGVGARSRKTVCAQWRGIVGSLLHGAPLAAVGTGTRANAWNAGHVEPRPLSFRLRLLSYVHARC